MSRAVRRSPNVSIQGQEIVHTLPEESGEQLLNLLLTYLPLITYVCKADGDYGALHCAGLAEEITGFPPSEFVTNSSLWLERLHPEDKPRILRELGAVFSKSTHVQEYRWKHANGSYIWLTDLLRLVRAADGTPLYLVGAWYDVSIRKHQEEELEHYRGQLERLVQIRTQELLEANSRLREEMAERAKMEAEAARAQKLESLGVLAGGIAHDFNNMLTGVLGNISVVKAGLPKDSANFARLATAEKACAQVRALCDQLLTFSRGGKPNVEPSDLTILVFDTVSLVLSGLPYTPELNLEEGNCWANVDRGQIAQVISNLVLNAAQAKPIDKVIPIVAKMVVLDETEGGLAAGNYVCIQIRDRGKGVPAVLCDRIFDPYFTTKETGHGLGLTMVYSIIKHHAGGIDFDSKEGEGTTVSVYLPAILPQSAAESVSESTASLAEGRRVLVVDDEEMILDTACCVLEFLGCEAVTASSGEQAIEIYAASASAGLPYDAVILDLTLRGGIDGRETLSRIRQIDSRAVVLLCSGYSQDSVMADFRSYGFDGAIAKPYTADSIAQALEKALVRDGQ